MEIEPNLLQLDKNVPIEQNILDKLNDLKEEFISRYQNAQRRKESQKEFLSLAMIGGQKKDKVLTFQDYEKIGQNLVDHLENI